MAWSDLCFNCVNVKRDRVDGGWEVQGKDFKKLAIWDPGD